MENSRSFHALPASSSFQLKLTKREAEVLQLIADGLLNKQIAQRLFVSQETIKSWFDRDACGEGATREHPRRTRRCRTPGRRERRLDIPLPRQPVSGRTRRSRGSTASAPDEHRRH